MPDIFISYAEEDRSRVQKIVAQLQARGWSVWWDRELELGKDWRSEIEAALECVSCVLVVWSRNSIGSKWVKAEAVEGEKRGILVPVLIDRSEPPFGFRGLQTEKWTSSRTVPKKVIEQIGTLLGPREDGEPVPDPRRRQQRLAAVGAGLILSLLVLCFFFCNGEDGDPTPPESRVVSFSANPQSIVEGEDATLRWRTVNASLVVLDPGDVSVEPEGERTVRPDTTTKYTLTVGGRASEGSATTVVEVRPAPPVRAAVIDSFTAEPQSIRVDEASTLRWSTTGADEVVLDGIGAVGPSGSHTVTPREATTYTLRASNEAGEATEEERVDVQPRVPAATIDSFVAEPRDLLVGEESTLRWVTSDAIEVRLGDGETDETVVASGSRVVAPSAARTYRLTAFDSAQHSVSTEVTIHVSERPTGPDLLDCAPLGNEGLLVLGAGGTLRKTNDGGKTWGPSVRPVPGVNLRSCCASRSGSFACAVGTMGAIVVSIDGGETWKSTVSGTEQDLRAVACTFDGSRTWAVGDDVVLFSGDQGGAWQVVAIDRDVAWLHAVSMSGPDEIWVGGLERLGNNYLPVVKAALDGGLGEERWSGGHKLNDVVSNCTVRALAPGGAGSVWASMTHFDDPKTVDNRVFRIDIGADEWEQVSGTDCPELLDLHHDSRTSRLWGVGPGGVHSSRTGSSWLARGDGALQAICSANGGDTIWAVGEDGFIVRSTDAGENWEKVSFP